MRNAAKHKILGGDKEEMGWGATKLLISLAFLPANIIEEGYKMVTSIIFQDCEYLQSFFNYYKVTWINGFKPKSFCVYKQLNRTNNISERHNRELGESLNKHSTIIDFLGIL